MILGDILKKHFLQLALIACFWSGTTSVMALTDTYFATGEDLDYIIESDSTTPLLELEHKLRRYVIFRKLEDYFLNSLFDDALDND